MTATKPKFTLHAIGWERIFLTLEVKTDSFHALTPAFYLTDSKGKVAAAFQPAETKGDLTLLKLNVNNDGTRQPVPNGEYTVAACNGEEILSYICVDAGTALTLKDKSRCLLNDNGTHSYNVTFGISEGEQSRLLITMFDSQKTESTPKKKQALLPKVKKKLFNTAKLMQSVYPVMVKRAKNRDKTVLFLAEERDSLGKNQLAVIERMKQRGLDSEYTILTSARSSYKGNNGIKSWYELIKKIASSGIIIIEEYARVFDWLKLTDTDLIQLWHGGVGFKSSGYSRWGSKNSPPGYCCYRQITYGSAGSQRIAPIFAEVWGINPENILPAGMPRMDRYLDENFRKQKEAELMNRYPLLKGKKVILFAPTFRGAYKKTCYYPYEKIDFERLYRFCAQESVVVFKMHPWISQPVPIPQSYQDRMIDLTQYPDINELFFITDVLITDYSSAIYEFSLMGKPMLFYAFDENEYSSLRGFHRSYRENAPGRVCADFDTLLYALKEEDYEFYKVKEYTDAHFDYIDGNASDRVIDWFILRDIPERYRQEIEEKEKHIAYVKSLHLQENENSGKVLYASN